jgi:S1-C subfamily serine protease
MTFAGPGVRFDDVVAGSPAASAGLRGGDVLVAVDGVELADLRAYSDVLKARAPGDRVTVTVVRGGERITLDVVLGAR